jgi:DNA polymerase
VVTAAGRAATPPQKAPAEGLRAALAGTADLGSLRELAATCRACELWERATGTVFGEGGQGSLMLVGEQPGDQEDREGRPFVGPAGRVLGQALEAAGIERERVFVTNVVKHFRWRPAPGTRRRLHETPGKAHVAACLPWVEAEIALVRPHGLVLMGATAAAALLGPDVRVSRDRGAAIPSALAPVVTVTIHPSAVLRAPPDARADALAGFADDLARAAALIQDGADAPATRRPGRMTGTGR